MIISSFNPDTTDLEKTYISAYQSKGTTTLPVKNNDRFVATYPILIGRMGGERSELNVAVIVNANKISIGVNATTFDHNADDPVYLLDYNRVRLYRATSLVGTKTMINEQNIDVDNADKVTRYDDTTSLPTHYYWTTYYNSVTLEESDFSDPFQAGGYSRTTIGNVIDKVVRRVRDTGYTVFTIQEYIDVTEEVGSDLITQAHRPYDFLHKEISLDAVAGQNYISLPATIWKYDYVSLLTATGNTNRYDEVEPISFEAWNDKYDNNFAQNQDNILQVAIDRDNNRLMIYPTPLNNKTAAAKLAYWKTFDEITGVSSVVETPNALIYKYKLMAEYYRAKSEVDRQWAGLAKIYEDKYGNEIVKMQRTKRIDAGTPRSIAPPRGTRRRRRYHL